MKDRVSQEDLDGFWDLSSLLPKKGKPAYRSAPTPPTFATVTDEKREEKPLSPTSSILTGKWKQTKSYYLKDNALISRIVIYQREGEYNFYGQFCRDALRYLTATASPCEPVHYFSYIPQYSQLNEAQKQFYFYWRSRVKEGEYLPCDESYLYLYVYEIINLPDAIAPQEGILLLCRVYAAYRRTFPRMDKYLSEWIADYCMVHGLDCPEEEIAAVRHALLANAAMKEFYLGQMGNITREGIDTALAFFSDYDFRESRYATGKEKTLFEEHILHAVAPIVAALFREENSFSMMTPKKIMRDAFCGSLCAHQIKCRIEVELYSLSDVLPWRNTITDAVKYAENKLRAMLCVKSRLSVKDLAPKYKEVIDTYFNKLKVKTAQNKGTCLPSYEALYDAPTKGADFSRAATIEKDSWQTTKNLIVEENEEEMPKELPKPEKPTEEQRYPFGLAEEECEYLSLLLHENGGIHAWLSSKGKLEEELVDSINEKCAAGYGDTVIFDKGDGFAVLPDYAEEVEEWIKTKQ